MNHRKICVMTKTDTRQKSNLGKQPFPTKSNEVVSIDFMVDLEKSVHATFIFWLWLTIFRSLLKFMH